MAGPEVGDPAPSFTVQDHEGNDWNAEEHFAEGTTVVYFYPADCTGGCTTQAKGFQADLKASAYVNAVTRVVSALVLVRVVDIASA